MDKIQIITAASPEHQTEVEKFLFNSRGWLVESLVPSLQQAVITAGGFYVGSVVAGPTGALVLGLIGIMLGYVYVVSNDFTSTKNALRKLDSEQKQCLMMKVISFLRTAGASNYEMITPEGFAAALSRFGSKEDMMEIVASVQ